MTITRKLSEYWLGTPGTPVNQWPDTAREMMRRQGFDEPVSIWTHLERLEARLAAIEEKQ